MTRDAELRVRSRSLSLTRHASRIVVAVNVAVALGVGAFWAAWVLWPQSVQSISPGAPGREAYLAYEGAFPLADGVMAGGALLGALGLWRRRPWGAVLCLMANGAMAFLALLDLTFAARQGLLWPPGPNAVQAGLIAGGLLGAAVLSTVTIYRSHGARPPV